MKDHFAAFGEAAAQSLPAIMISGRHPFHADVVGDMVSDVMAKLKPAADNRLLEIGCGTGLILRPLAAQVKEAVGIDHPSVTAKFAEEGLPGNLRVIGGRFPEQKPEGSFDRILAYSVLHYMADAKHGHAFIDACVALLAPGGIFMLGDLPNMDMERRFKASGEDKAVTEAYQAARIKDMERESESYAKRKQIESNVQGHAPFIDDGFILGAMAGLRLRGFEAHILPQPASLPFSMTREDFLVRRRL